MSLEGPFHGGHFDLSQQEKAQVEPLTLTMQLLLMLSITPVLYLRWESLHFSRDTTGHMAIFNFIWRTTRCFFFLKHCASVFKMK